MKPYISIVTATYNSAKFLQRCIDSVAGQTFRAVEHIVIDGASTDGTVEIIRANEDKLAYWVSEPDTGVSNAWNKAVPQIKGEWVLFLGSDDRLEDLTTLQEMKPYLEKAYPDYSLVYGILTACRRGTEEVLYREGEPWADLKGKKGQWRFPRPPHPSTFHHRSLFEGDEPFDETYKIAGDAKFLARAIKRREPLFAPVTVTRFSTGGLSGSMGQRELVMWQEERRLLKELNIKPNVIPMMEDFLKRLGKEVAYKLFREKGVCALMDFYRLLTFRKPKHLKNNKWK
jgi:glycosyltransferase involved in cell wall biosynthesis